MNHLGENILPWLNAALDLSYRRNSIIAGNLANVDTPNYAPRDIEFEDVLISSLESKESAESMPSPRAIVRMDNEAGLDGNRVDIDQEIANQASNKLFYEISSSVLQRKLALLKYSIDAGGM